MSERILVVGNLAKDIIKGEEYFGGSAANIAVGVKRMGLDVGILSVSAKEKFSKQFMTFLQGNGIDISLVEEKLDNLPVCEVVSDSNDDSSRRWSDNGSAHKMKELGVKNLRARFDLAHLVSCPPLLAEQIALTKVALSYEPGPRLNHDPEFLSSEVVHKSLLLFFNQEEYLVAKKYLKGLTDNGFDYPDMLALVITLGELGSRIVTKNSNSFRTLNIPVARRVDNVIDYTGAGDNYKAGFLSAFVRGKTLEDCAQVGSEMALACISQRGGILSESKVEEIRKKYQL